jgi:hypothetical protein
MKPEPYKNQPAPQHGRADQILASIGSYSLPVPIQYTVVNVTVTEACH